MAESEADVKVFASGKASSSGRESPRPPPWHVVEPLFSDIYFEMEGKSKLLLIFNHFKYKRTPHYRSGVPKERNGTAADARRLREVFSEYEFKVEEYQDLDYDEILDIILSVTKRDLSEVGCFAVAVMSHGHVGGMLYAADRPYYFKDLWSTFSGDNCQQLVGVPKLFFIQACRGDDMDSGVELDGNDVEFSRLPTTADFLMMFSTVEDFVSWRDTTGSWFMQALCDTLVKCRGKNLHLLELLTLVNHLVATSRASNTLDPDKRGKKQMPQITSTLTKLLLLS